MKTLLLISAMLLASSAFAQVDYLCNSAGDYGDTLLSVNQSEAEFGEHYFEQQDGNYTLNQRSYSKYSATGIGHQFDLFIPTDMTLDRVSSGEIILSYEGNQTTLSCIQK